MAQSPATKPTAAVGHSNVPCRFYKSMTSPFTLGWHFASARRAALVNRI